MLATSSKRFYMNVHTRPSHSGMFDKENPPKPPSPKGSYIMKLVLLTSVAIGLNSWLGGSKTEKRRDHSVDDLSSS